MYERPELVEIGEVGRVVLGGGDDWAEEARTGLAAEGIPLGLDD